MCTHKQTHRDAWILCQRDILSNINYMEEKVMHVYLIFRAAVNPPIGSYLLSIFNRWHLEEQFFSTPLQKKRKTSADSLFNIILIFHHGRTGAYFNCVVMFRARHQLLLWYNMPAVSDTSSFIRTYIFIILQPRTHDVRQYMNVVFSRT